MKHMFILTILLPNVHVMGWHVSPQNAFHQELILTDLLHSTIRNAPGGIPAVIDDSITTEVMVPVVVVIAVVVEMLTVRVEADAIAALKLLLSIVSAWHTQEKYSYMPCESLQVEHQKWSYYLPATLSVIVSLSASKLAISIVSISACPGRISMHRNLYKLNIRKDHAKHIAEFTRY